MFGYDNPHSMTVTIADPTKDNVYHLLKVPSNQSKIEITRVWAVSDTTVTAAAGTGISFALYDYGTAGTAVAGTLVAATAATALTWTANVPQELTIVEGTVVKDHYVVFGYDETGTVAPLNITIGFEWVSGIGA